MEYKTTQSIQNIQKSSLQKWVMPKVIWPTIGYVLLGSNLDCGGLKGLQPAYSNTKKIHNPTKTDSKDIVSICSNNLPKNTDNKTKTSTLEPSNTLSHYGNSGNLGSGGGGVPHQNTRNPYNEQQQTLTLSTILTPEHMALVHNIPLEGLKSLITTVSNKNLPMPLFLLPFLTKEEKERIANLTPEQRKALINELNAILASKEKQEDENNGNQEIPLELRSFLTAAKEEQVDTMTAEELKRLIRKLEIRQEQATQEEDRSKLLGDINKLNTFLKPEEQQNMPNLGLEELKNLLNTLQARKAAQDQNKNNPPTKNIPIPPPLPNPSALQEAKTFIAELIPTELKKFWNLSTIQREINQWNPEKLKKSQDEVIKMLKKAKEEEEKRETIPKKNKEELLVGINELREFFTLSEKNRIEETPLNTRQNKNLEELLEKLQRRKEGKPKDITEEVEYKQYIKEKKKK
ncbi:hypothetical protein [Cardinium endosymbiont of Culicoides punctatus]|uniref:hypothetical protein n=1 Tax=Cardinium endosymbiont of Culicoides punctatus TaxID=2304601 RepID=UPI001058771C|nr:hypothetical protein [Cardinium endosymbiont of Culicoides punctatus]TDG94960.1 hypothetical protein CCPUN_06780 [Cardinium endosymbiont of Culicoides punctatus]